MTIPITKGLFVVKTILLWDPIDNIVFYTATTETNSQFNHVYAVKAEANQLSQCLTCDWDRDNVTQNYFAARFSKNGDDGKFILLGEDGPSVPKVDIYSWEFYDNSK